MKHRLHTLEGTEPLKAQALEKLLPLPDVGAQVFGPVGVAADGEDLAPQVPVELQNGPGGKTAQL